MRKALFGFVWFVAFYFAGCMLAGMLGSMLQVSKHPGIARMSHKEAYALGAKYGREATVRFFPVIVGTAVTLSIAGSAFGVLPGTRSRREST